MDETVFINTINQKAKELSINPILLLSGIEGLYTFKDVELSSVNFEFLDSLILTIFALRIGDEFHRLAEENLVSNNSAVMQAAAQELRVLSTADIEASGNHYLHSFHQILGDKTNIRNYHVKALEVAAVEIRKTQILFSSNSIGTIILQICKEQLSESLDLGSFFNG